MNRFQGINSASLCSLAGRYDNPIPPRFLAHIDSLKIPAQGTVYTFAYNTCGSGIAPQGMLSINEVQFFIFLSYCMCHSSNVKQQIL